MHIPHLNMELQGKSVAVIGLCRSGVAAANLLTDKGAKVRLTDCLDNQKVRENLKKLGNRQNIIELELGRHSEGLLAASELVVVSPGVARQSLPMTWARKRGIPVISEIELAFAFCPAPVIAITGTNGKTTVTTLVGEILKAAGRKSVVCGNIGNPFCGEIEGMSSEDVVVLEVSSFQLETIDKFRPKVAAVLNLTPDHLDRYSDFDEYRRAKQRIFLNQSEEDWAVLNAEDPYARTLAKATKAKVCYFSKNRLLGEDIAGLNSNYSAACSVSLLFGAPKQAALKTCQDFKGIEHRLEELTPIQGINFINDSKATNVDSTIWALNYLERPIVLIAGGRDKGSDFSAVRQHIAEKVRAVILFGEAKEKIRQALEGVREPRIAATLSEAVKVAFGLACPGESVLFSPMCASFDMFNDYAERGRVFKQEVLKLAQGEKL